MGQSILPPPAAVAYKQQVFLASGTFTLPTNSYNMFDAILVAGGGGGAKPNSNATWRGGNATAVFLQNIYCTNGTTLTITVGAGAAAKTTAGTGNTSTASEISGITGNGTSTSVSSNTATGGKTGAGGSNTGNTSFNSMRKFTTTGNNYVNHGLSLGVGFGAVSAASGNNYSVADAMGIFNSSTMVIGSTGNPTIYGGGTTGGPLPLLGSLLHATVGTSGTASVYSGGISDPNTFFAGGGGSTSGASSFIGKGGGGGGGGRSNVGATLGGAGGNGSANSGGGGGAGGVNTATGANSGNGGSGGSGFVIIGYWG